MEKTISKKKHTISLDHSFSEYAFKALAERAVLYEKDHLSKNAQAIFSSINADIISANKTILKERKKIEFFNQVINQNHETVNSRSYCLMIFADNKKREDIDRGLKDDIEKHKGAMKKDAITLRYNGNRASPQNAVDCNRVLSVIVYDMTQLKYLAENLYQVPPLNFYNTCDYTFQDIITWSKQLNDLVDYFTDIPQVKNEYIQCKNTYEETERFCNEGQESLNHVLNNTEAIKCALENTLKSLDSADSNITDINSLKESNRLCKYYNQMLSDGNNEDEAISAVAKKYYRSCNKEEVEAFASYKKHCGLNKMSPAEIEIFGNDYDWMIETKSELMNFENKSKKELLETCIPLCIQIYYKAHNKCSQEKIYDYAKRTCNNDNFFSFATLKKYIRDYATTQAS